MAFKSSSSFLSILALFTILALLVSNANARPSPTRNSRFDVRAAFNPATFTTESTTTDSSGVTSNQSCTVTLSPIVVNGQDEVQQVTVCVLTPVSGSSSAPPAGGTVSTTTAVVPSAAASGAASLSSAPSAAATASSALPAAFSILGDSSATISSGGAASATPSASVSDATAQSTSTSATSPAASKSASQVTTSLAATATAVAASAAQSPAQFSLPGKTLSVLPIGLGVFAGISVIALIVVGWVTYERTKYRKAFRARKLAEAGGAMGYGGMAEARV